MTVPATARRAGPYNGNGSTTSFSFSFKTFAAGDLLVTKMDALGVETTLVLNSDYSVTLNGDQDASPGGTITYPISGSALPTGQKLTIIGDLDYEQTTDLLGGGAFNARVIEDTFDRATIQIQQLEERLDRALLVPVNSTANVQLPNPEANELIGWNSGGTALQNVAVADLATAVAYGTFRYDTFTGTGAQTQFTLSDDPATIGNLDVSISGVVQVPGIDYSLASGVLVFTSAPANGTTILARYGEAMTSAPGDAADISFHPAGTGAVTRTTQAKMRDVVSVKDFGAVGNGVTDDTAAINAAITHVNTTKQLLYFPPGEYKVTSTLATFTNAPGICGESSGLVVIRHYASTDCIVAKGSYKHFSGFTATNQTAAGAGTSGHALVHIKNCAYGFFEDIYTAHDLDGYSGFLLEQEYTGSAEDATMIAHYGCWYNNLRGVNALYRTIGETRGFGITFSVNANAKNVVNPPGEAPGTYTGSISFNIIDNPNVEARAQGIRFDTAYSNIIRGGQLLGCAYQVRLIDARQNTFFGVKHNQWLISAFLSSGSSGKNAILYPTLFNITATPWSLGTLASDDVVMHVGEAMEGTVFSQSGVKFPATQINSSDVNTLDDYEEGLWVPALKFGGANTGMTYNRAGGKYTKIGNQVTVIFDIRLATKGSSTGSASIENLPFASSGGVDGFATATIYYYSGMSGVGKVGTGYSNGSTTISELVDYSIALTDANFTNTSILLGEMTYLTA